MTPIELKQALDQHCIDMQRGMPGCLFYGILSVIDGTTICKEQANDPLASNIEKGSSFHATIVSQVKRVVESNAEQNLKIDCITIETDKIIFIIMVSDLGKFFSITALDRAKSNLGVSRAMLYKCKAEFGTILDDSFY